MMNVVAKNQIIIENLQGLCCLLKEVEGYFT